MLHYNQYTGKVTSSPCSLSSPHNIVCPLPIYSAYSRLWETAYRSGSYDGLGAPGVWLNIIHVKTYWASPLWLTYVDHATPRRHKYY